VADQFLSALPESSTREALRDFEGVRDTSSVLIWFARIPPADFALLLGLRPGEFALDSVLEDGQAGFSSPDAEEVLLGGAILERLGKRVGDEIPLEGGSYRIVGTFRRGKPFYDNAVVLPLARMQEVFRGGADIANFVAVRVAPGFDRREVAARVEERLQGIATVSTLDELSKIDQGLDKLKIVSVVITVVATGLGLLFVLLSMLTSVLERVREVGILRAVGWTKRKIVAVVLLEALVFCAAGVALGIPTGILGVEIIGSLTEIKSYIRPTYDISLYLRALFVAVLAAGAGGIYPAWRAARLHPVEAIRHE
jgi:putative ABC transport system permease protein